MATADMLPSQCPKDKITGPLRPPGQAARLCGLDAMRGAAALVVLLFHIGIWYDLPWLAPRGYLAVDFFFMLSGFVMERTYGPRFRCGLSNARFVALRYLRLWPCMLMGALFGLPIVAFSDLPAGEAWAVGLCGLLLVPTFALPAAFPVNGPAWSVFAELAANFIHPLVHDHAKVVATLVCLCAIGVGTASWLGDGLTAIGPGTATFWGGLARAGFAYFIGMLLYQRFGDNLPRVGPIPAAAAIVLIGIQGGPWQIDPIAIAVLCPPLLAYGSKLRAPAVFTALGALSFPLYAVHLNIILFSQLLGIGPAAAICFAMIGACAVSWLDRRRLDQGGAWSRLIQAASPDP